MRETAAPNSPVSLWRLPVTRRGALVFSAALAAGTVSSSLAQVKDQKTFKFDPPVSDFAFSPDGRWLAIHLYAATLVIQDLLGSSPQVVGKADGQVFEMAYLPDGTRIVTHQEDVVHLWDAATAKPVGKPMQHESLLSTAVSADGTRMATRAGETKEWWGKDVHLWDLATTEPVGTIQHEGGVRSARFSPDGTRIVTASLDRTARLWDGKTGEPKGKAMQHRRGVLRALFSPDGRRVVTLSRAVARVWDGVSGEFASEALTHDIDHPPVFSPDGRQVVLVAEFKSARMWDFEAAKPVGEVMQHESAILWMAYLAGGSQLATVDYGGLLLWDAVTGKLIRQVAAVDQSAWAAFSPDGSHVAFIEFETVTLRNTASHAVVTQYKQRQAYKAGFSPDGRILATASGDGTSLILTYF